MLQWMGGSRRKLKTSRKSIQNRQHQYFQQRKRQQRAELLEQNVDDPATVSQNIQESKSLDVASLMNISLAAYATGVTNKEKGLTQRKADSKNEETRDHVHITCAGLNTEHHLVQNASFKADAETQWTPSSATEAAKASGHTKPFSTNFLESSQRAKHEELKEQNSKANHPPKRFSVLDIISDNSKGSHQKSPLEAYAAFAIEGTGKIKDKTPDNFEPMKGSSALRRVEKLEFDHSAMPVDASLLTPESQFGWEDENHQKGIVPEKISISNNFMAPSGSHKENAYSFNDSEFQEKFYIFSCNGSSQKDGPLIDVSPSPTTSNMIYDNHLSTSNFASARHVMDAASNLLNGEGNSLDCSHVPFFEELEPKEKGCRFTEDDIQVTFLDLSEKKSSIGNTNNHGVYKIANLRNNVNYFASDLDCSSSSTFNPHFTMNFGTKNGDDSWDEFRTDESYSTSIGNISWLHDHPVDRNCLPFDDMTRHLAKFVSLRTENGYGININSEDGPEVKGSRIISPVLPNFYAQAFCEMQEDNILEQFSMGSTKDLSGDSLTSPYLEEISVMPEKSDESIMVSHSQRKMEVTAATTDRQCTNDKRAPMILSPFKPTDSYHATFQTNGHTASKPSSKNSKSSVSGKLEPTKEGNKSVSSSLHHIDRKEQKKSHRTNFIENQDKMIKLNTDHSSKNFDKASRSVDQDKIVICEHEDLQILATQHSKERSIDSKHKTFNLQIESSFECVHNQEDIQLTETRIHIDEIHHLELKQAQSKETKTQETHLFSEDIKPMCPETEPNAQREREEDRKTKVHSKEIYVNKQSLIDISEMNNEKFEPQENKSTVDNRVAMEYQGMLESYILQLRCMYKALQHTLDQELYDKGNDIW